MEVNLTVINDYDRNGDLTLKPDIRKRVLEEIGEYIQAVGFVNVSLIARQLGLSKPATKDLVNEVIAEWVDNESNQLAAQVRWYEQKLEHAARDPEHFGLRTESLKIEFTRNMFNEMNKLRILQFGLETKMGTRMNPNEAISYIDRSSVKPRTVKMLENANGGSTPTV